MDNPEHPHPETTTTVSLVRGFFTFALNTDCYMPPDHSHQHLQQPNEQLNRKLENHLISLCDQ